MIQWRLAAPGDGEEIVQMCLALFTEDPGVRVMSAADVRQTLEVFASQPVRGRALVLDLDGLCAGYAFLSTFWSNELGGEICVIDELYVQPGARGSGHATALLGALSSGEWPGVRPVALELESTPSNHRARSLYVRLGFKEKRNTTLRLSLPKPESGP